MRVIVEPYNPIWAIQFQTIKHDIEGILQSAKAEYKSIEHVGSTSVPGLAAKPCIDIDIVVSEDQVQPATDALMSTGLYENLGDWGFPQRWAFRYLPPADNTKVPVRSTYITVDGCQSLRNHLAVREMCTKNPELRDAYSRVKLELAQREFDDVSEYWVGKTDILGRILTEAGMPTSDVEEIRAVNIASRNRIVASLKQARRGKSSLEDSNA